MADDQDLDDAWARNLTLAIAHHVGERTPGNLDPYNRPALKYPEDDDGTTSSVSVERDGSEILLPTSFEDTPGAGSRRHSVPAAIQHYDATGQHLGTFDTAAHADAYATALDAAQQAGPQPAPRASHYTVTDPHSGDTRTIQHTFQVTDPQSGETRSVPRFDLAVMAPQPAHLPHAPMPFVRAPSAGERLKGYGQTAVDWLASQPLAKAVESVVGGLSPLAQLRDAYQEPGGLERLSYDPNTYITAGERPPIFSTSTHGSSPKALAGYVDKLVRSNPTTVGDWLKWHGASGNPSVYRGAVERLHVPMSYEQLAAIRDQIPTANGAIGAAWRRLTPEQFLTTTPLGQQIAKIQTTIAPASRLAPAVPVAPKRMYAPTQAETGLVWAPRAGPARAMDIAVDPMSAPDPDRLLSLPGRPSYIPYKGGKVYIAQHDVDYLQKERAYLQQMKQVHTDVHQGTDFAKQTAVARRLNDAQNKWRAERKAFYTELGLTPPDRKLMAHLPRAPAPVGPAAPTKAQAAWTPEMRAAAGDRIQNRASAMSKARWAKVREDAPALGGQAVARSKPAQMDLPAWTKFVEGFEAPAHQGLSSLHNELWTKSFDRPKAIETMGGIEAATGRLRGGILVGTAGEVEIPETTQQYWRHAGTPIATAHTHPASMAFSAQDFRTHDKFQADGMPLHSMLVFGRDGSWYDLRWPKQELSLEQVRQFLRAHGTEQAAAFRRANATVDEWVQQQWSWRPDPAQGRMFWRRPDGTGVSINELEWLHPEIKDFHEIQTRNEVVKIWEHLAPHFQGTFRYHLAPR